MKNKQRIFGYLTLILSLGFILLAILQIMPSDDDWSYLTIPYKGKLGPRLLPHGAFWRPFDALFGCLLGLKPSWFPSLNHICVYIAHLGSSLLLYRLCRHLKLSTFSIKIAVIFFFLSPAMLGTLLGVDSLNQAFAGFWGACSLFFYLTVPSSHKKYILWLVCAFLASFSKENGLSWFIIPPLVAFGFSKISLKQSAKEISWGFCCIVLYLIIRFTLQDEFIEISSNSPYAFQPFEKMKDFAAFFGGTWFAIDFISLFYIPYRNWSIAAGTFLLSMPFFYLLFIKNIKLVVDKKVFYLLLSSLIAAALHLLTYFGPMHSYAGLFLSALVVGFITNKTKKRKYLILCFTLYLISAIFVDIHHGYRAYQSGQLALNMGQQAINKTGRPVESVYNITITVESPRYSSFCIPACNAFSGGHSAEFINQYKWPKQLVMGELIPEDSIFVIPALIDSLRATKQYDCIWLDYKDNVEVINLK